jgi:hypothetical protein
METIGTILQVKVASFLPGTVNAFDICAINVKETSTGAEWVFHVWNTRDDAPALARVLNTQRLALVREAAFRKLPVRCTHQNDSSVLDAIAVDVP